MWELPWLATSTLSPSDAEVSATRTSHAIRRCQAYAAEALILTVVQQLSAIGTAGPVLMEDYHLVEKLAQVGLQLSLSFQLSFC